MTDLPRPPLPAMAGFQADPTEDRDLVNVFDYERRAAELIETGPLAYYAGGALDERTLRDNRAAFERRRIVPRVLTDVSAVDPSIEIFGRRWPVPIWICPTALQGMAHPDGELATARAAAARGLTMTLSTSASTDMAEVAAVGGSRWYQVYLLADPGARRAMVERAVEHGYEAFVLTADLQRLGRRERDVRVGFRIPEGIGLPNVARAAGVLPAEAASVSFVDRLTVEDVEWLAGFGLPVIVKGVLHPEDAGLAIEHGAAAIAVSNHGGRQLDGAIASLDALPAVVEAVAGRVPVLLDGGIRRGTDALLALAMGATAIGIGRPVLWGLGVDGEAGVGRVLDLLVGELVQAMALAGAATVADLRPDMVASIG
ncbi:MAG TPA: alpha-hydroxy acid oxidase [Gemmatimonadaceae bacterium]|jgi:isopentenyl diphosphate isomerase/L-lactate dehydrogenase-like FMN-dependent dehydrogenase